jgi:hypothetical protein
MRALLILVTMAAVLAGMIGILTMLGCDDGGLGTAPGVDAGSDADGPCTQWGCVITNFDAGLTCVDRCLSHDPVLCPGPFPCK